VVSIGLITIVNLRGLRESGTVFAAPTYLFLGSMLFMLALGIVRTLLGDPPVAPAVPPYQPALESLSVLILARAFADGCSAMTGTEAVANGVPAFKPVEWKNAQHTMLTMSVLLATMFIGLSYLIGVTGAQPSANGDSVLSQVAAAVFGGRTPLYYILIFATMGILVLAANTSFADFPRLSSILARDGFFPRQFAFRGDRLAFSVGIVFLALASIVLVVIFSGDVNRLIPLYAIGVFTSFTLSQSGMVRHWWVERGDGWRRSMTINAIGAVVTAVVVVIFAIAKFGLGAWIVLIIVPLLVIAMLFIRREYGAEERGLAVRRDLVFAGPNRRGRVLVAASAMNRALVQAVKVAETMSDRVELIHVTTDPDEAEAFRERVEEQLPGVRVVIVESPYRTLVKPFVRYVESASEEDPDRVTIVLLPEHMPRHWWDRALYNQNAHRVREALVGHREIVVLDVPYRRDA